MALHVLVDATSPGLHVLCGHARNLILSKLQAPDSGMLAVTVLGSPTTSNLLSAQGLPGYENCHTIYGPAPCRTAALDSLDELCASEGERADAFSALVVAVYSLNQCAGSELAVCFNVCSCRKSPV